MCALADLNRHRHGSSTTSFRKARGGIQSAAKSAMESTFARRHFLTRRRESTARSQNSSKSNSLFILSHGQFEKRLRDDDDSISRRAGARKQRKRSPLAEFLAVDDVLIRLVSCDSIQLNWPSEQAGFCCCRCCCQLIFIIWPLADDSSRRRRWRHLARVSLALANLYL